MSETSDVLKAYAADNPQRTKEYLSPHLDAVLDTVIEKAKRGRYSFSRLFLELLGLAGAQMQVAVHVWQQVGARDASHAKQLIDRALETEGMDELTAYRLSKSFVEDYERRHAVNAPGTPSEVRLESEHAEG